MITCAVVLLAACQEPAPPLPDPPPDPTAECDGWGDDCSRCCEPGYTCQRGLCINGSLDLDFDGVPGHWDCDDYQRLTYPGAAELCDDRDNNCNGVIDEGVRNDAGECAPPCTDTDADGVTTCDGDCDDDAPEVLPGAEEVCDGVDNDCNGQSDEGFDEDGDGVGACGAQGDCDDADPLRAPGFVEVCDGLDNDCNDLVDDHDGICGRSGECTEGECRWDHDAASDAVDHETGSLVGGFWCAGPEDRTNAVLVSAPAGGVRDMPYGLYEASFTLRVDDTSRSWRDCGVVVRLRTNDRDGDGTGTCQDCYFGGDVALVAAHFDQPNVFEEHLLSFSIGPERDGHLVEVLALRGNCQDVTVCVDRVDIGEQPPSGG